MKRFAFILITICAHAQEPVVFQPPHAYEVSRYEAGWNKNPFTLKTAPAAILKASFAQDLAIVTHYGAVDDPTIVLANIRTQERISLKKGKPSVSGMKLEAVNIGVNRKETFVQVGLGGETARLRYDEDYLRRMAAAQPKEVPKLPKPAAGTPSPASRILQTSTVRMPLLPQ